jgi:serine phosphatase RsbU (regulator of sigma subunit)
MAVAGECDQLRQRLTHLKGQERVKALEQIYACTQMEGDYEQQLKALDDYIAEAHRQGLMNEEAYGLSERATLFYNNDINDSIFIAIPRQMKRVKELDNAGANKTKEYYYDMWSLIAQTHIFLNHNKQGLRVTEEMYAEAKSENSVLGMGLAYRIMGTAYSNLRNFDESRKVFQSAIELLSTIKPLSNALPDTYTYYGNALNDMKDYKQLEQLTKQWKDFLNDYVKNYQLQNTPTADLYWAYYYFACVQAALGQNKLADASKYLGEASSLVSSPDSYVGMKWLYYEAQLHLMRGEYAKALDFNTRRLDLLTPGSDQSVKVMVMLQRAEIMQKMLRYEEASALYRDIYVISDSINAQDTKDKLNEMNTIYQLDQKEMENERLQMQNERNRFRFIIIVVSVTILSLAIFLFFRIRSARKLKQAHGKLQTAYSDLKAANEVIEETTAAKERIESELRIARDIQMSMVTNQFPERDDLDIYASMSPAKEVGGDLYNLLLIEEEKADAKLYFALGDVSGKGVPASLFMAQATRLFRTLAKQQLPPAEIATRMNDELGEDNEQGMFVTMFLGLVDLSTGHLDFCNAGHNPPVIMNSGEADTSPRFIEMEPNAPIGLWPGLEYVGEEIADIRQQPLFIYTDGLNEAENRKQEQFGDDRLLQMLAEHRFENSKQLLEIIAEEVEKHRDGAEPNDDLTMMCVMIKNTETKN